jgi:hypothetical protein
MLPHYQGNVSNADLASAKTTFQLGELRRVLVDKTIELLSGTFNQFAFFNPKREIYAGIVEQTLGRAVIYPEIEIRHQKGPQGLTVFMFNTGLDPFRDCHLLLQRLDRYSPTHDDFERNPFQAFALVQAGSVLASSTSNGAYLPLLSRTDKSEVEIQPHAGGTAPIRLNTAGTWRARLAITVEGAMVYTTDLFFTWAPGSEPEWVATPQQRRAASRA